MIGEAAPCQHRAATSHTQLASSHGAVTTTTGIHIAPDGNTHTHARAHTHTHTSKDAARVARVARVARAACMRPDSVRTRCNTTDGASRAPALPPP